MPILSCEPFVYPEGLFEEDQGAAEGGTRWWVLHTRPRAEKSLARTAHRHEVPFFLPLYKRRWRNAGRTFSAFLPLFPGYLFLCGGDEARQRLLDTRFVANCLPVADQARLRGELARVYDLMTAGVPMTPEEKLVPGTRVLITGGPMRGVEGKVVRHGKQLRLVLEVEFIRRGVSVEVESWMVKPITD
jgi:transcriptional antiterminator RfaH